MEGIAGMCSGRCAICGKDAKRGSRGPVGTYCSKLCRDVARNHANAARRAAQPQCQCCVDRPAIVGDLCGICEKRRVVTGSTAKTDHCLGCGVEYKRRKGRKTQFCHQCFSASKAATNRQQLAKPCEICGKMFSRKARQDDSTRACSRECGYKLLSKVKDQGKGLQAENERASALIASLRPCDICGAYIAGNSIKLTCSKDCQRLYQFRKRIGRDFTCLDCGLAVAPKVKAKYLCLPKRCRKCEGIKRRAQRRAAKQKQPAPSCLRKRLSSSAGVTARLAQIIKAERGVCPLCGLMLSTGCDPNHDRHVEFDHRLPRSRGGTDDFDNLRAVCRRCNGLKGAFIAPELVLIPRQEYINN